MLKARLWKWVFAGTALAAVSAVLVLRESMAAESPLAKLIIVDPGHFHASLLQREMYAAISPKVEVYAPLGPELLDYLTRVSAFNNRSDKPTSWELDVHSGPDSMERMLRGHSGNVVIFTGKNRGKIDRINASLSAGINVFADKPWIISSSEFPKLEQALEIAKSKGLTAYDIMTERYEITSILQRELLQDADVFGELTTGSEQKPAITARSVHMVMKVVGGIPLRRPTWFFDVNEYGEGLADVGTHVVDLMNWTAFPSQPIDYRTDIKMLKGRSWPLPLTRVQFEQVTGEKQFPSFLDSEIHNGVLNYRCNNSVDYTLRGKHVHLDIEWAWQAPDGAGDVYESAFRGTSSTIEIRQGVQEQHMPTIYVVPNGQKKAEVFRVLQQRVASWQSRWPGIQVKQESNEASLVIPEALRTGHEAHFAEVGNQFLEYLRDPKSLPEWERADLLAKYYVTTKGVELGRQNRQ